ncbi:MAG TPA: hypothetical protein VM096_06490 [Vicinamibacterales bacterium]|nr:hypothetical protein [Vicinamibacterales bacterium]
MSFRLAAVIVITCLCGSAAAQTPAPNLTKQQRDLLQAIVTAVDAAATQPETADVKWQHHILRASDGSHYVAFSAEPPATAALPAGPALLYVRLATATAAGAPRLVERSPIREWLAGGRVDPRLLPNNRGIAVGEMPIMGPTGNMTTRQPVPTGSNELKLMALERERARQEQADRDKKRRNELEGKEASTSGALPFEDFDLGSHSMRVDGTRIITRALTAGPGDYDLFLAWADTSAPKPATTIRVLRKKLSLDPARTLGLITSDIVLADSVAMRAAQYTPAEQASHPYSIGLMEIVPSRTNRYSRESNLSLAFQVINAQSNDSGMPDINVTFAIVRVKAERESAVASLKPQAYNATTLPADFNLKLGHPLFAAVSAPLASLARGDYRLKIAVHDRIANTVANSETDFSVIGTAASLLAEAPPLGRPFSRDVVLDAPVLVAIVDALMPASPSPALQRAAAIAKSGKLADLLIEEPVPAAEVGVRTVMTGLALFSIGDASSAVQFQRALQQNAPAAPTQFLLGAARAMQSRDPDAINAWHAAIATGSAPSPTTPLLIDAYLRRNDVQKAMELAAGSTPVTPAWTRSVSATHIALKREGEAVALLDALLKTHPDDQDARWLLLHALYAQFVHGGTTALPASDVTRFSTHAREYLDAKGTNAALAEEWLKVISSF